MFRAKTLKELPITHVPVSSSDIVEYLQNELGFQFDCDFQVWDNRMDYEKPINTTKCYVVMRAVFRPEDIIASGAPKDFVDKTLKEFAAAATFKDTFMNTIKPFMFPEEIRTESRPEVLNMLAAQGIYGDRLQLIQKMPGLFYDQVNNRWGVFLRPEAIIKQMVEDPDKGAIQGVMAFGWLNADTTNASAITWGVNIYKGYVGGTTGGVTIDAVFNSIKG